LASATQYGPESSLPHFFPFNQRCNIPRVIEVIKSYQKLSEFFEMSSLSSISFNSREESIDTPTENLPESISNEAYLSTPSQKRGCTAESIWEHTRKPKDSEPERGGKKKNLIYYCKYCNTPAYSIYVSTTFRLHLTRVHSIEVESSRLHPVKRARTSLLREAFAKASKSDTIKLTGTEKQVLQNALDKTAVIEALVQLITVQNLPYNCSQWPELHALLMAVNPTVENVINVSHGSIQRLVSNSYSIHKVIL
jgi:hypothetical protein